MKMLWKKWQIGGNSMKVDELKVIEAYKKGLTMNAVARDFHTYPTTVKRILAKYDVPVRYDGPKKGVLSVKNGKELIEWAKAQGRPVTKAELAKLLGKARLNPSYFTKYPELGKYVVSDERKEFHEYYEKLYKWLEIRNIPYKRNDRTKLNVAVDVLLLGEYSNIAIEIVERPKYLSNKVHKERIDKKINAAHAKGMKFIELTKANFDSDLEGLEELISGLKK